MESHARYTLIVKAKTVCGPTSNQIILELALQFVRARIFVQLLTLPSTEDALRYLADMAQIVFTGYA
jgi:hypothetical protein